MDLEKRVKELEKKVAALELKVQEQPNKSQILDNAILESKFKYECDCEMLEAYDANKTKK